MDPNATLKRIREIKEEVFKGKVKGDAARACLYELTTLIDDLDEWLSNAGFPPNDWS